MRFAAWVMVAVIAAGCGAAPVSAQDLQQNPPRKPAPPELKCIPNEPHEQDDAVMMDMPYHAKFVSVCRLRLANGTVVKRAASYLIWRDSAGRVRIQSLQPEFGDTDSYSVRVVDPVAHLDWSWEVGKGSSHQAFRTRYQLPFEWQVWPERASFAKYVGPPSPNFKDVRMKARWVNGVYAVGDKTTEICKPGENGNNTKHPVVITDESWLSVDLGEVVRDRQNEADGTEYTDNLYVLDRYEPDPNLFAPPAGYQILRTRPATPKDFPPLAIGHRKPKGAVKPKGKPKAVIVTIPRSVEKPSQPQLGRGR